MVSCSLKEKDLYGTWYKDLYGERNAVQFSKNEDGRAVYTWVVYDISADSVKSSTSGYYYISEGKLTLTSSSGDNDMVLGIKLDGDKLKLSSDTSELVLTKFELED